ncbi:Heparinase II/III-like protein [Verrucomicrobium sp. GAS474]|uniref:heparinase II/III family protein n=1 Tax=Verrucomicrobium sp. GAS474 TaxID=1882831 RepID=UPI00087BA7E9|nr:heparinase II/III family protein [Verrucomicrobium sp. GAS474]SDU11564.1 Heparinase II/III-like protein [Verrucomicrobium sp. GAS474]
MNPADQADFPDIPQGKEGGGKSHPRLILDAAGWGGLKGRVREDALSARLFAVVLRAAQRIVGEPPVALKMEGHRLLGPARLVLRRVLCLAITARLTEEAEFARAYAERAIVELRAAARLADWNPSHFLDTAEMTLAMALGRDWLHDYLTPEERTELERAIAEKGIAVSFPEEETGLFRFWLRGTNNWTQVCHAGIAAGALAIDDIDPALVRRVIERAVAAFPAVAEAAYAPEGVYAEGANYWGYGTAYHVVLIDLLRSVFGRSFDLEKFPGFLASADYLAQMTAPTGIFYNYADARELRPFQPPLFWFARERRQGDLARADVAGLDALLERIERDDAGDRIALEEARFFPLALLWHDPSSEAEEGDAPARPLAWLGRGKVPVAVFRSAWDDPEAVFVGIKGGSPSDPHAHMDVGSMVVEADGIRWAVDPGMQEYDTLESVGVNLWDGSPEGDRWKIFRLGPEAHSILRFGEEGAGQRIDGRADFVGFGTEGCPHAILDLTPLYDGQAASVRRGIAFRADRRVMIQDEWTIKPDLSGMRVTWQWLTRAAVTIETSGVLLEEGGKTLRLRVLAPLEAGIEVEDVGEPRRPYDAPNPGLRRILFRIDSLPGVPTRLAVLVEPGSAAPAAHPFVVPLSDW